MEILCVGSLVEFVDKINNIARITTAAKLPTQEISITIKIYTLYVSIIPCYFGFYISTLHFIF